VTSNVNNNAAKQKNAVNIDERKYSFLTRGFLGSLNTNIATAILSEIPGAQFSRLMNTNVATATLPEVPCAQV
ncbi:hypothetical protein TSAR_008985, partial [Trichomalopsis sarcophagae]